MHLRPDHTIRDLPTLHSFIREHPLGVLTTSLPSKNFPTLQCSHIPWVLDGVNVDHSEETDKFELGNEDGKTNVSVSNYNDNVDNNLPVSTGLATATSGNSNTKSRSKLGTLRGHIARANPQTKALIEAVTEAGRAGRSTGPDLDSAAVADAANTTGGNPGASTGTDASNGIQGQGQGHVLPEEILIVFTSPVDHYITPQFYSASVAGGSGKVAPTWNYAAVQVYGRMTVYHDVGESGTGEFLTRQLGDLARLGEVGIMGYVGGEGQGQGQGDGDGSGQARSPWKIADAPVEYISMLKKGIVGMEVEIMRIEGRFKGSQEKGVGDREGVIGGLEGMGGWKAREMANFVRNMSR